jgi:hypothetical protein
MNRPLHSCLESRYPHLSVADLMRRCPKCRGICSCRNCLRASAFCAPRHEGAERRAHAARVMAHAAPQLALMLGDFEAEVGRTGEMGW